MGIVNASPDSFSDAGLHPDLSARLALARQMVVEGAQVIDVGGESAVTGRPRVPVEEELERVVPLVEALARDPGVLVSVDTRKPAVAAAAIQAGARMVNDVSGLRDPELADVCADTGAALVLMHTLAAPGERRHDPGLYGDDPPGEVASFLAERMELARARGVADEQLVLDPGPDFAKTPAQTVAVLRGLDALHALGRPLLLALSRKDFLGAITGRAPRARGPATLAAVAVAADAGAHLLRVHEVAAARDVLAVRAVLRGEAELPADARLPDGLRHEPPPAASLPGRIAGR
jgi:dihydropteroate synthase